MNKLITHVPAGEVSADFQAAAAVWPLWDSATHPQKPKKSGKFIFDYNGDYATERVLIVSGNATVTPTDKTSGPIALAAGDAVHFHKGFRCAWHVTQPMTKRYAYFGADGKESVPAQIACDECGAECVEQSWCFETATGEVQDICPRCYKAAGGGAAGSRFAGAEYQEQGEPATGPVGSVAELVEEPAKEGKKRPATAETTSGSMDATAGGSDETGSSKKAKTTL